jgi:hypothetical protein
MSPRSPKPPKGPTPVEAIKHKDTRKNIPTEELRDLVAEAEATPATQLYPRDASRRALGARGNHRPWDAKRTLITAISDALAQA